MTEIKTTEEKNIEIETKTDSEVNISLETNCSIFTKVIDSISDLMEDSVTLRITPLDIIIRCMDKSRFVMVDLNIKSAFFDKFNVNKETIMTILIPRLKSILNRYRKNDIINISLDNHNQLLLISLKNDSYYSRDYTIPLILSEADNLLDPPTNLEFSCNIIFNHKQLTNISNDLKTIKSGISINANQNELIFSNSKNKNTNTITIPKEQLKEFEIEEEMSGCYNLDTFKSVLSLDSIFSSNTIQFSPDRPLILKFSMDNLTINYLIAPEQDEKEEPEDLDFDEEKSSIEEDEWDKEEESNEEKESNEEEKSEEEKTPEKEYPNLSECLMGEIEKLANTDLKMLKIEANKQLDLEIKKQAHKKTVISSIKNKLFPEED